MRWNLAKRIKSLILHEFHIHCQHKVTTDQVFLGADCSRGPWQLYARKLKKGATEDDSSSQNRLVLSGDQTRLFDIKVLKVAMQWHF